uniref:sodium:proton antiporter NhaD n=1 Tax=Thermohahella caldifontis TaxID=3142973 RepID=UPI003F748B2D
MSLIKYSLLFALTLFGLPAVASEGESLPIMHATGEPLAIVALILFVLAYVAVMAEEVLHLRKSKPVMLAAGIIWVLVALIAHEKGMSAEMEASLHHNLIEYAQLFLFLLVAMTYINALEERHVFESLRSWLVVKAFSYRKLFWVTGFIAFFLSPVADNLTTALILGAVILAVGGKNVQFVTMAMINVVVAANAGGAFSPFGDITTLMVWQSGHVEFGEFLALFVPSLINFVVPAAIMYPFLPKGTPHGEGGSFPSSAAG